MMVLDVARILTIGIYLALLVVTIMVMRSCDRKLDHLGWIFVAIHGLIFYSVRGIDSLDGVVNLTLFGLTPQNFYNLWSTLLRIHTLTVAILGLGWFLWTHTRGSVKHGC